MNTRNRVFAVIAISGIVYAVGQFMGDGYATAGHLQSARAVVPQTPSLASGVPLPPAVLADLAPPPDIPPALSPRLIALNDTGSVPRLLSDAPGFSPLAPRCAPQASALPSDGAMIALSLRALCHAHAPVQISHAGMRFSETLDENGSLALVMPALESAGEVTFRFLDGTEVVTKTEMFTLAGYRRSVLQWSGDAGFRLNAFEGGAAYGQDGHVSPQMPRDPQTGVAATGGFLTLLGSATGADALHAQVYSFPADRAPADLDVRVEAEVDVSATTCGRTLAAQALVMNEDGSRQMLPVSLPMPVCDTSGGFISLKNLFDDLTFAQN
ncbi:hypothetical protein AQS8620_00065 [Aquimixticola soesokkakensis]|uniref:Translocase n=1 Tax=Aquimixticola soesokkakensis TaxID=1519096 RepID=A0A1Y5R950_9RHOB|nr:hypothetical protein [Aquimixticola soesokkakensis]SLN10889.1 hypothetical protein AQS8620_00065 [Aquimixticola soesokkakensis]